MTYDAAELRSAMWPGSWITCKLNGSGGLHSEGSPGPRRAPLAVCARARHHLARHLQFQTCRPADGRLFCERARRPLRIKRTDIFILFFFLLDTLTLRALRRDAPFCQLLILSDTPLALNKNGKWFPVHASLLSEQILLGFDTNPLSQP